MNAFHAIWLSFVALPAAASCLAGGRRVRRERWAWFVLAGSLVVAAGSAHSGAVRLASLAGLLIGFALLVRARPYDVDGPLWFDGIAVATAVGAVGAVLAVDSTIDGVAVSLVAAATSLLAATGWRPDRTLGCAASGVAAVGAAVLVPSALAWAGAALLVGLSPWQPTAAARPGRLEGRRALLLPSLFASASVGVLVYGNFRSVGAGSLALATASLAALVVRTERGRRMIAGSWRMAGTDPLTGLGNRRRLQADLGALLTGDDRPAVLVLLDLDGFKSYNDTFGHPAGDALLVRLAQELNESLGDRGEAYRMGGDEFCVLAPVPDGDHEAVARAAAIALEEDGDSFTIGCSYGYVRLPEEANDPSDALRVADRRMYVQKDSRRSWAGQQTIDVLSRVIHERDSRAGGQRASVASLADAVGERLGLDPEELVQLHHAAALHDIGKLAIPETILEKPGPLNTAEWDFIRAHPVVGERILSAAPALSQVARIVRSTHERVDGSGYPDGLAGEAIPLAARIISVCDALCAMTSDRPYAATKSSDEAFAELRRAGGTQLDPVVVAVTAAVWEELRLRRAA
ncbi:MAG: diguanylate cyclase [Gaiellaceae bacterium MAG52_C11]|nr:diguanylate cyclase [Candidatus Gaiellasilicea maunaloa]